MKAQGYDGTYRLVGEDGVEVNPGDVVKDFRGQSNACVGGKPPHKPGASGYVRIRQGEYYASVFGLEWVREEQCPT